MVITGSGSVDTSVDDMASAWVIGGMMEPMDAPHHDDAADVLRAHPHGPTASRW